MKIFNKTLGVKIGFTLSEILITLGVIGTISAITIPTIAYNYRAKVLEEQFRTTYSDLREIGSRLNYDKGDVGTYANKTNFNTWQDEFMKMINGGNNLLSGLTSGAGDNNISTNLRKIYKEGGASPGPWQFNLNANGSLAQAGIICDNGSIWMDSRGRLWTFNSESRIICVDINGTANPNRINIDIFAFIPMDAEQVATWVYDDPDHPENYTGAIIPCNLDLLTRKSLSNAQATKPYVANKTAPAVAYDTCPFFEPVENIAAVNSYSKGKSARNKNITAEDNYWKTYIDYK